MAGQHEMRGMVQTSIIRMTTNGKLVEGEPNKRGWWLPRFRPRILYLVQSFYKGHMPPTDDHMVIMAELMITGD